MYRLNKKFSHYEDLKNPRLKAHRVRRPVGNEGNARDICPPLANNLFCVDCFTIVRNDDLSKKG